MFNKVGVVSHKLFDLSLLMLEQFVDRFLQTQVFDLEFILSLHLLSGGLLLDQVRLLYVVSDPQLLDLFAQLNN